MANAITLPNLLSHLPELHDEQRLKTEPLAVILDVSPQTLEGWRCRKNGGPPFEKLGPQIIRYRWGDVRAWIEANRIDPNSAA